MNLRVRALAVQFSRQTSLALVVMFFAFLFVHKSFAQTQTFNSSGTFTVPAGVTSITVQAWGAGGGGGNGSGKEGGGGGGAYASSTFSVTAGNTHTITVGAGGAEGTGGGASSFDATVIALGGSSGSGDNGFAGGSGPSSTGMTKFSGGSGGGTSGGTSGGGGGGGSATSSANGGGGTNGTGTNPGAGGTGTGAGGDGGDDDGNPAPEDGFAPGGGGGGSSSNNTSSGSGADGRVTITWTCSDNIANMGTTATTPVCTGNTSTVTVTSTTLADGTYTVYYNLSGANTATAQSGSMTFSGVTGAFSTIALANSGATTITITSVGCANVVTGQDFTATVTVNAAPATPGAITGTASVCPSTAGLGYSISAVSGATSYTWTVPTGWSITAGQGTISITVTSGSASQSGNITVTATNTCGTSAASTLAVLTVHDIGFNNSISTNTLSICAGTMGTTIDGGNPSGGETYNWQVSTTGIGGPFANVSPASGDVRDWTVSSTYYNNPGTYYFQRVVSGSSCNGNSDVVTLTVNANPTATISVTETSGTANDGTVCNGTLVTLGVASASSYLWAPGGATTQTIMVTPAATTTYTVTVTNAAGCTSTDTQVITVNAVPTINSITATPSTICAGASSTLAVVAANNSTQSFSNNTTTTIPNFGNASPFPSTISVSGLPTSGITVANVSFNNVSHEDPDDMDIYLLGPNNQVIWLISDAGGTSSVTNLDIAFADGGTALSTSTLVNNTTYAPADLTAAETTPGGATLITTMAGFTGNMNGTWSLYINDDSNDSNSGDLEGWTITFNTPNYTYAWTNSATTASTSVSPLTTTTYTVTVTIPGTGCAATASTTVTVNTLPTAAIAETDASCTANDMKVLSGDAATLTASGGVSYLWDGGSTSAARVVNPLVTTTYTVTVTDVNGCTDTETKQITVVSPPAATIGGTISFCTGGSTTLTAGGGGSYLWDDASTNAMRSVNAAGTYTVQVTDGNGCTDTETATVTVNPLPTAVISGVLNFCTGGNTILTASGGTSYLWNDLSTNDMLTVNTAGAYTVQVTDANGCTDTETATVTAGTPATADAGGPYATCGATPVAITATASGAGMWSGGSGVFASATSTNTTYTPTMAEFGTTVTLYWTTNDPDGAGGCPAVTDNAGLAVSGQNIEAKGNGMVILNGDATPSAADHTDFGSTTVSSGMITKTFTILNSGTSSLTLTGGTPVTLSGAHAGDFTVLMQPTSPVGPMGMDMFQVQFDPSAAGMRNATVNIASNDCDVPNYTFDITGKGAVPQAISVFGNGNQITNRASTASVSDDTDFGSTGGMVSHTFTINNIANGSPLSLTGVPKVTIADRDASDFTVTASPASPIDGGSSTTFTIKFQPGATGLRTAQVIITHNDLPENPFVFTINGTGL